ncbi:hypothetical protein Tco_0988328 [Tanacetum coccineum]|uniref:Uncharacterized protein n=1 Tax=Tanacetum coccineum TaxID=301880 RepID=A0ABQ5ER07_9ASTR
MVEDNVGNQFRPNAVQNVGNQYGIGNVVTARAEANGACEETERENANCTLLGLIYSKTNIDFWSQSQSSPSNDSDGSAKEHLSKKLFMIMRYSICLLEGACRTRWGGTVEQHYANVEETCAYHESLFHNLAAKVEKVNSVNRKMKETNAELTTELARYKNQEKVFEIMVKKNMTNLKGVINKADESLAKHKALELEIKRLLRAVVSQDIMSIVQNHFVVDTSNLQTELEHTLDPLPQKLENENVELEFQVRNYEKENDHLMSAYKNLFDSINVTRAQTKTIVSEQKDTTKGMSTNTLFCKQSILGKPPSSSGSKLYYVTPFPKSKGLPKIDESHALINPFKASRVDNFVPNKHVKASVRTKPITVSQPNVMTKNEVNSKTNGLSPKDVKSTTRTKRPQPRNNSKNDKSSSNQEHMSSECNNIKLAIRNAKSEVVCAMCKQCLITVNHDVCVLNYVNDMNSRALNKNANVSNVESQKKHKPKVKKLKKVGSKERLASPKPNTPRSCLGWSPTGRIFNLKGKIIATSESVCQSDCSKGDNACTSNPQEPISKRFPNSTFSMTCCQNWFDTLLIPLLSEYKPKDKENHGDNECDI